MNAITLLRRGFWGYEWAADLVAAGRDLVEGPGFRVSGFRGEGLGLRVWVFGFGV